MKKVLWLIILFFFFFYITPKESAFAFACTGNYTPTTIFEGAPITVVLNDLTKNETYRVFIKENKISGKTVYTSPDQTATQDHQSISFNIPGLPTGVYEINARDYNLHPACIQTTIEVKTKVISGTPVPGAPTQSCVATFTGGTQGQTTLLNRGDKATLTATGNAITSSEKYVFEISGDSGTYDSGYGLLVGPPVQISFQVSTNKKDGTPLSDGTHVVIVRYASSSQNLCTLSFAIGSPGAINQPSPLPTEPPTPIAPTFPCAKLVGGKCEAVATAVGDIPTDPDAFIAKVFLVLLSMGGGWAVYLIITAGYQLMFSSGNPEGVKEAQEKITSAIVGLIFMVLSLVILKVIGVDIFALPTFVK